MLLREVLRKALQADVDDARGFLQQIHAGLGRRGERLRGRRRDFHLLDIRQRLAGNRERRLDCAHVAEIDAAAGAFERTLLFFDVLRVARRAQQVRDERDLLALFRLFLTDAGDGLRKGFARVHLGAVAELDVKQNDERPLDFARERLHFLFSRFGIHHRMGLALRVEVIAEVQHIAGAAREQVPRLRLRVFEPQRAGNQHRRLVCERTARIKAQNLRALAERDAGHRTGIKRFRLLAAHLDRRIRRVR